MLKVLTAALLALALPAQARVPVSAHNDAISPAEGVTQIPTEGPPQSSQPDDESSPFTPDGRCKPGRLGCFYIEPPDDEAEPPPDAAGLETMRAVRESIERLESRTPHNKE